MSKHLDPDSTLALLSSDLPSLPDCTLDINDYLAKGGDESDDEVSFKPQKSPIKVKFEGISTPETPESPAKTTKEKSYQREAFSDITNRANDEIIDSPSKKSPLKSMSPCVHSPGRSSSKKRDVLNTLTKVIATSAKEHRSQFEEIPPQSDDCKNNLAQINPEDDGDTDANSLNSSTDSNWFNNTHDEMILFEKFGENYDEIVSKMTLEENKKLKKEVRQAVPKTAEELLGKQAVNDDGSFVEHSSEFLEQGDTEPPLEVEVHSEEIYKKQTCEMEMSLKLVKENEAEEKTKCQVVSDFQVKEDSYFKEQRVEGQVFGTSEDLICNTFTEKKCSSHSKTMREVETLRKSIKKNCIKDDSSPEVHLSSEPLKTPSKIPASLYGAIPRNVNVPSYLRPTSASKHRSSPRRDPRTKELIEASICSRHCYAHTESPVVSSPKYKPIKLPGSIDLKSVKSPVAQYIKDGRAPLLWKGKPLN